MTSGVLRTARAARSTRKHSVVESAHFLIVDDNEAFCRSLQTTLRRWGESTMVGTVDAAICAIQARAYSAAFIDARLEPGSGLDVLADLRRVHPETPAMVLAGLFVGRDSVRACELQANYVEKPVSSIAICAFVEAALPDPLSERERPIAGSPRAPFEP
jgi:DNA-binding NtrC family response regulator